MKTTSNLCPQTEDLRQLLSGSLPSSQQQTCTEHMDSCECCQARLEELATEGTNLSQVVAHVKESEPTATSAYWPALQSLTGDVPVGAAAVFGKPPAAAAQKNAGQKDSVQKNAAQQANVPQTYAAANSSGRIRDLSLDFLLPASDTAYLGRLAHFDVMRVLGRGGMGVVLEAFDSRLQRNVAAKVLDPELADDEVARQRFCREARAAASITHENVVAVHQVEKSSAEGLPYMVMQLIAGESLEQRLARDKTMPLREIVRVGMQAASGLAAARPQGLIHRDIKPGNILLEAPNNSVKLTDFGLARVADDVKLTRTGFVTGTPLYIAPEQAMGEVADPRSDLFSLGAILYEMCAGQPPFAGNSALAILKQIADAKHTPLRELNPAVPEWLSSTIDRLLAKKPSDRIQTAAHLAELLEFHWALMKTSSDDVPNVCQIAEKARTRRNRLLGVAVGATFLVVGLLGGMFLANRPPAVEVAASSGEPIAVLSANAGAVWTVSFDRASRMVAMGVEDGSVRLWDVPTQSVKATLDAHRGVVWSAIFAHRGELLATSGDDGLIKLWQPDSQQASQTFEHRAAVRALAFAHDDRTLFAGDREGTLRAWSVETGETLASAKLPGTMYTVSVSPDDQTLATAGSDKVIRLWNAKTLTQKLVLEGHSGPVNALSFSQDGRRLASAGWDRTVRIWDAGSGLLIKSWEAHGGDVWAVAYSPDRSKLATAGIDGAVKLWNSETGELLATYLGHKIAIHTLAFNHDGTLLASGGRDGAVRIWAVD